MLWEALAPGRPLPQVRGWRGKGLLFFAAYFLVSSYLPLFWDGALAPFQLLDLSGLGSVVGTLVGLLVYEVGAWVYHRTMHRVAALWRVHQTHHSAERVDAASAFLFHPLDMVGWTLLTSLSLVLVVGITPAATTNVLLLVTVLGIFQHTNVKTPRWLGYVVQRPESHSVHHAQGIHDKNYADLPLIDLALGTFENPAHFAERCGLYPGASKQNLDLLLLRDVVVTSPQEAGDRAAQMT
jgi:sterol desaturase/sphingolipid hydroxylase (fatty acid hydroxylase superfamily)